MNKNSAAEPARLLSAGYDVKTPFDVNLSSGSRPSAVTCIRVLRNLPKKRLVCEAETNGEKFVAKFFLDQKKGKKHSRREIKGLSALKKSGLHTPRVVFTGSIDPGGKQPVILLEFLNKAEDFTDAWQTAQTDARRRELMESLAAETAALHEAGLIHQDAHPGNFMVCDNIFYAIDGASVDCRHQGSPLSTSKSIQNLAAFFAQFSSRFDSLLLDAFDSYINRRGWKPDKQLETGLKKQIQRQRKKREKKHLKKIYRQSSAQVCSKAWDYFMVCKRDCRTPDMDRLLADPDSFIARGRLLKNGNSSTVALVNIDDRQLVVKRYNMKNVRHALSRCARPSRAWRCWKNAHQLSLLGIETPRPIAMLERRLGPFRSRAYFITDYVPGPDAYHWFHARDRKTPDEKKIIEQFGDILQNFHDALIVHGDLKATNFIFSGENLVVIDLDSMHSYIYPTRRFHREFQKDCRRFMQNWEDLENTSTLFYKELSKRGLISLDL
ncbi:MAG: hypothetical protein KFF46_08975 [Desulfobacterales bacterium]|nr:hypothetical protein [Desulfobacterales bacterium]